MSANKKNLLEAFRNAGDVPLPQDEPSEEALQPLTPEEESLLEEETRLQADLSSGGRRPWSTELPAMPVWLPWIAGAGILLVIVIAVFKGFSGGEDVQASGGDEATPQEGPPEAGIVPRDPDRSTPVVQPPVAPEPEQEDPASPLYDPANAWTVVVVTYSKGAASAPDFAWATHDHLRDAGVPAFPPVEIGNNIVVIAGAAPRFSDLADLEAKIESLSRDGRSNVYKDAYPERIDKFIDRY